ncbi:MAG: glycosyl hydrolase 53 family protein, partial [Chitinivibrionales bacterium]
RLQNCCTSSNSITISPRINDADMKFLLDFHYSDTWADPGKQYKPVSWEDLSFGELEDTVRGYTLEVLEKFEQDGNLPDMVQVGNEIAGGMIWPDGQSSNMSNFAALVNAGIDGVKDVDSEIRIMIHSISENSPSSWLSNLINAGVNRIDVFGLSYYSEWHGTPDELNGRLTKVAQNHNVKIVIAEYADNHERVNDIVYNLPEGKGIGTFVWEPADWMDALFDWKNRRRETNERIDLYPELAADYGNVAIKQSDLLPEFSGGKNTPDISSEGILRYNLDNPSTAEINLVTLKGRVVGDWSVSGKGRYNIETNLSDSEINQGIHLLIVERPGYKRRVYRIGLIR